ncbi:hypothetical protein NBT05_14345 [Aquimarina sp. ERC-38]|nr:hypothetical protein NBT05_14345 [Aquimarina sp. ERC-38]
MVEKHLQAITSEEVNETFEISSFVKKMTTENNMPSDLDYKEEYSNYLLKKYQ